MKRTFFTKFFIGYCRFFGVFGSIIGLILFFQSFGILIDPEATIQVNGVLTSDFFAKIGAVLFTFVFVVISLLLFFLPASVLEKIFIPKIIRYKK